MFTKLTFVQCLWWKSFARFVIILKVLPFHDLKSSHKSIINIFCESPVYSLNLLAVTCIEDSEINQDCRHSIYQRMVSKSLEMQASLTLGYVAHVFIDNNGRCCV